MPQLTFMQNMSDKASRLLPCSFTEIVYDTTSEVLTSPDYENIMFICDQTNKSPEAAKDVILAVRRRIEDSNPKVQYFTIILLDALVKNCYDDLHNALADTPALQNCLVAIAVRTPIRDGEFEAKKAALQLILNMSYWFIGATEDKTKMLCKLADEVRAQTTPLAFEDIEADAAFQLKRGPPRKQGAPPRRSNAPTRSAAPYPGTTAAPAARPSAHPRVVDAIPVLQYTGDEISGMLDACMLLSEMINSAEEERRSVVGDELVTTIAVQVRKDHRKLAILLSSGAEMENLEVLLSVADSQTAIIQRLSSAVERDGRSIRDVAGLGADEDENSAVTLQAANRPPPQQVTRTIGANAVTSSTVDYDTKTTSLGKQQSTRPRRTGGDGDAGEEMGDSGSSPTVGNAGAPRVPHAGSNFVAEAAAPNTQQKKAGNNEQELDSFFGGGGASSSPPHGDHNTASTNGTAATAAQQRSAAPAPYQISDPAQPIPAAAPRTAANTDFFESMNAPSAGVVPSTVGSVNNAGPSAGTGDEFDDFLNSRLQK